MKLKIGVLNSGGDCPGLNAVISSVVKCGISEGFETIGFKKGFEGLIQDDGFIPLTMESVRGISHLGGTILGTTNKGSFSSKVGAGKVQGIDPAVLKKVKVNLKKLGVDCLIVIGGDGSLTTALQFQEDGICKVIGVPKTIDNDLDSTDKTFGFSTGVEIIKEGLSRIHTTAVSHDRVFFVETMGRNVGWLALYGGMAGGADMILLPEIPFRYEAILEFIRHRYAQHRSYTVIAVAEGAKVEEGQYLDKANSTQENHLGGVAHLIASKIEALAPDEFDIRTTVLGHLQRGGPPIAEDVILSERFGYEAIQAIKAGKFGQMLCLRGNKINTTPIKGAVFKLKEVSDDHDLVKVARSMGISFGE